MIEKLTLPVAAGARLEFAPGSKLLIQGELWIARDMVHRRLTETKSTQQLIKLGFEGGGIYYCGPTPTPPGKVIGSAGPTTSSRMDPFTPAILDMGIKVLIGKGPRSQFVLQAIAAHGAIYLITIGGAGALLAKSITSMEVVEFPELGPEALARIKVTDFPVYVASNP